jgi:phosphoribosylglycinamide formyltransferase 2
LPIPNIHQHGPSASYVILGDGHSRSPRYRVPDGALSVPDTALRLFGKPEINGHRRLGVALARAATVEEARARAKAVVDQIVVELS